MVFQHSGVIVGGEILHLFPDTPTKLKLSRVIPMVFQHSGGEILKPSPDTPTTLKGYPYMVFQPHSGGDACRLPHTATAHRFDRREERGCTGVTVTVRRAQHGTGRTLVAPRALTRAGAIHTP